MIYQWLHCNDTNSKLLDPQWKSTFGILMIMISIFGTFENGILLVAFCKYAVLRTKSNRILISMTLADFFTGCFVAPLYVVSLFDVQLVGNCNLFVARKYIATVFMGASAFSVGFISLDRASLLIQLQNYKLTSMRLYVTLVLCWVVPMLIPLAGIIGDKNFATALISLYVLVGMTVTVSYVALLMSIRKHRQTLNDELDAIFIHTERKAVKTILMILSSHFVMIFPMLVSEVLYSAGYFDTRNAYELPKGAILTTLLCTGNCVANPAIYCNRVSLLRKHVLKLFRCERMHECREVDLKISRASKSASTLT